MPGGDHVVDATERLVRERRRVHEPIFRDARAYQRALPVEFAVTEIRKHAGSQFDPNVVDLFLELAAVNQLPLELSA